MSEKAVLRVSDLLDWITNPKDIEWDRGILGVCHEDCISTSTPLKQQNSSINLSTTKTTAQKSDCKKDNKSSNCDSNSPPPALTKDEAFTTSEAADDSQKKGHSTEADAGDSTKENGVKIPLLPGGVKPHFDNGLNAKFSPGHSDFLADIRKEKENIGEAKKVWFCFKC